MEIQLDKWQQEILEDEKNHILLAKGRRIGATHLFAQKAVEWLEEHGQLVDVLDTPLNVIEPSRQVCRLLYL